MSKLGKTLTFIGVAGAALAGLGYFLTTTRKQSEKFDDFEDDIEEEEKPEEIERSYVSLEPSNEKSDKEVLEKVVKSAVDESIAKASEVADGVGLVKGESEASDFEFKSFDEE